MHTAIGRPLAIAIALSLCFVTASFALPAAQTTAKAGKPLALVNVTKTKHKSKKSARLHRTDRKAAKSNAAAKQPIASNETSGDQPGSNDQASQAASAALPPEVANAHAELSPGEFKSDESSSTLTESNKTVAMETASNGVQIAGADQLNDIDRDLAVQTPAPAAPMQVAALSDNQNTMVQSFAGEDHGSTGQGSHGATWIGKIFVGLGAILTLASAARMLIA